MPRVSPAVTDSVMPSATLSAPKLLLTFSSARIAGIHFPPAEISGSGNELEFAPGRNAGRLRVVDDHQLILVLASLHPLAEHHRGLADISEWAAAAPFPITDPALQPVPSHRIPT